MWFMKYRVVSSSKGVEEHHDKMDWCQDLNINYDYKVEFQYESWIALGVWYFMNNEDATAFRLRFG
jgi:hypothetical protein